MCCENDEMGLRAVHRFGLLNTMGEHSRRIFDRVSYPNMIKPPSMNVLYLIQQPSLSILLSLWISAERDAPLQFICSKQVVPSVDARGICVF